MTARPILHPIPPFWRPDSEILILGSFPSVKSREQGFFYGHPRNRFWLVLAEVFDQPVPAAIEEKKAFLERNKVALWDVVASCTISGSADSSIDNVIPNDIQPLLAASRIDRIFVNGGTAKKYYDRYLLPSVGLEAAALPSTSPANAAWSAARLTEAWSRIRVRSAEKPAADRPQD